MFPTTKLIKSESNDAPDDKSKLLLICSKNKWVGKCQISMDSDSVVVALFRSHSSNIFPDINSQYICILLLKYI